MIGFVELCLFEHILKFELKVSKLVELLGIYAEIVLRATTAPGDITGLPFY